MIECELRRLRCRRTVARVTAEHLDERRVDGLIAIRVDE